MQLTMFCAHGYRWELRRAGDRKIGLWRKCFRKRSIRKPIPTRLVFIPGFGDTPLSWIGVLTLLEPVLRWRYDEVVLLDFPGYNGRLAGESLFDSFEVLLDSLFDVLDSLKPHTVIGHSLGGALATHYAAACGSGKRVGGKKQGFTGLEELVVIDASGFFEDEADIQAWDERLEKLLKERGKFWRPFIFAKEPVWFRLFAADFLKFLDHPELEPFIRSSHRGFELKPRLPEIRAKVSLVWGENDTLLPANLAQAWMRHLTGTRTPPTATLIRGAGHSPQAEAPGATAMILAQVLSGVKLHALGKRWYREVAGEIR